LDEIHISGLCILNYESIGSSASCCHFGLVDPYRGVWCFCPCLCMHPKDSFRCVLDRCCMLMGEDRLIFDPNHLLKRLIPVSIVPGIHQHVLAVVDDPTHLLISRCYCTAHSSGPLSPLSHCIPLTFPTMESSRCCPVESLHFAHCFHYVYLMFEVIESMCSRLYFHSYRRSSSAKRHISR